MKQIANKAITHGFKVAIFSSTVMVWDNDGYVVVNTIEQLNKFKREKDE